MSDFNEESKRWLIGKLDQHWDENSPLTGRIVLKIFLYYLEIKKYLPFASGKEVYAVISKYAEENVINIPSTQAIVKRIIKLYSEWCSLKKLRDSESPTQVKKRKSLEEKLDGDFVFEKDPRIPPKIKKRKRAPLPPSPEILPYKRPVMLKRVIIYTIFNFF